MRNQHIAISEFQAILKSFSSLNCVLRECAHPILIKYYEEQGQIEYDSFCGYMYAHINRLTYYNKFQRFAAGYDLNNHDSVYFGYKEVTRLFNNYFIED
jgi:hypothetical protein